MKVNKLSIIIPVYNENETFMQLFEKVESVDISPIQKEIVIVDDCSTDGTTDVLKKLQNNRPDIKFVFKEVNEGKGFALRDGFGQTTGDYVIVQDADLEYDPNDYHKLLEELENTTAEVVYGSRFMGVSEDMMGLHYFGNKLVTMTMNLFFGISLTDMETCYKLLPGDFIRAQKITASRFDFEPEITSKIIKSGMEIHEVPINYKGRMHSAGKKLTWVDGFAAIYTILKFRFKS